MKKLFTLLSLLSILTLQTGWSQSACSSPEVTLINVTNHSATLVWSPVPEASSYIIEIYKEGATTPQQILETDKLFIVVQGLEQSINYQVKVYARCPFGVSDPITIKIKPITVEDSVVFILRGIFTTEECTDTQKEPYPMYPNSTINDVMQNSGNVYTVTTPQGHIYSWSVERANNELQFRSRRDVLNGSVRLNLHRDIHGEVNQIDFIASNTGRVLWTFLEGMNRYRQPTFSLIFYEESFLDIANCKTKSYAEVEVDDENCKYCLIGNSSSDVYTSNLSISPNPTTDQADIKLSIDKTDNFSINIYDISGKLIENLHKGILEKGIHDFYWQDPKILRGTYFIELKSSDKRVVKKLIKL